MYINLLIYTDKTCCFNDAAGNTDNTEFLCDFYVGMNRKIHPLNVPSVTEVLEPVQAMLGRGLD